MGEHSVSKNPFAIAVGSYENINKIIKCTNDVLFLREDRNVMLSDMGLEWLKQADSTYNVSVFARRGGGIWRDSGGVHTQTVSCTEQDSHRYE